MLIGRNNRHAIYRKTFVTWRRETHTMIHDDEIAEKKFAKIPFVVSTTSSGHVLDESLWDVTKETRT